MEKQVVIIHGGTTFDTYEEYFDYIGSYELTLEKLTRTDWKDSLGSQLPDFEIIYPKMPNARNARYSEWKIWFEKLLPILSANVVLVGHSLGGIFLAKYLSENKFQKNISSLHLVAAPYNADVIKESLTDFALEKTVENLSLCTNTIFLYQSKDDQVVAFADVEKYARDIPSATLVSFENRGHLTQETFPELIKNIIENS